MITAELTTMIGQLNIVKGAWQNEALNQIAVREPKNAHSPGNGKGDLFVLTEILGNGRDYAQLEQKLAETVSNAYYLSSGSITTNLRQALQTAAEQLYDYNAEREVEARVVGGVVALVNCQSDVFVAQIGPTAFFAISEGHVERYPAHSTWLDAMDSQIEEEDELALGMSAFIEPHLFHVEVNPNDVLLLGDSNLVNHVSPSALLHAAANQNVRGIIKNLSKVVSNQDCSALALSVVAENDNKLSGMVAAQLSKLLPHQPPESASEKFPVSATATSPDRFAPITNWLNATFKKSPSPAEADLDEEMPHISVELKPKPRPQSNSYALPHLQHAKVMTSTAPEPAFEPELQAHQSPVSLTGFAQAIGTVLLMFIAATATGLRNLLGLMLPQANDQTPQAGRQATAAQTGNLVSWKTMVGIAVAIPLIAGAIITISYLRDARLREAEYTTLITTAKEKVAQVATADGATGLSLMAETENLLVQAEKIKTDQPEIKEMRAQIAAQTDTIGKVQRLGKLSHLRSYPTAGTNLKEILVQGVELYVMDTGLNQVYHHRLDNTGLGLLPDDVKGTSVIQQGQVVSDLTVDKIFSMVWMPSGGNRQTSDLLLLGNVGLFEYNANWGVTASPLTGVGQLIKPVSTDSFFGNFYVLDAGSNKLLRYLPTTDGYSAAPESYFPADQSIDLTAAVDMAIDGAIYVLFQDGHISKYTGGHSETFNISGLDKPFKLASAIFTAPNEEVQHLYIADAGNQRIVQLNKDGSFVRQFKPELGQNSTFANLQDIFVDEIGQKLYILDSNNLYLATMPTP